MSDKITNLHPKNDMGINLKPNIINENIPDKAVTFEKLSYDVKNLFNNHGEQITKLDKIDTALTSYDISKVLTESEILTIRENVGNYLLAKDTFKVYKWNPNAVAYSVIDDYLVNLTEDTLIDRYTKPVFPNYIYLLKGNQYYIYPDAFFTFYDSFKGRNIYPIIPNNKSTEDIIFGKINNSSSGNERIIARKKTRSFNKYIDPTFKDLNYVDCSIKVADKKNGIKMTALFIGDSFFDSRWSNDSKKAQDIVRDNLTNDGNSMIYYGTYEQYGNQDDLGECYSGKSYQWFCGPDSPFYNPYSKQFDFEYYMKKNNFDWCIGKNLCDNTNKFLGIHTLKIGNFKLKANTEYFLKVSFNKHIDPNNNNFSNLVIKKVDDSSVVVTINVSQWANYEESYRFTTPSDFDETAEYFVEMTGTMNDWTSITSYKLMLNNGASALDYEDFISVRTNPSYVVFHLGINPSDDNGISFLNTMIESIHSYLSTLKIIVCTMPPTYYNETPNNNERLDVINDFIKEYSGKENDNIYLIPYFISMDRSLSFRTEHISCLQFDEDIIEVTNDVHPNDNGIKTLAYWIYNYLEYLG